MIINQVCDNTLEPRQCKDHSSSKDTLIGVGRVLFTLDKMPGRGTKVLIFNVKASREREVRLLDKLPSSGTLGAGEGDREVYWDKLE